MSILEILLLSLIVGSTTGLAIGIGTARMFHAPKKQGLGAFRTLGEINACNGDPISHTAFGLGFFFNSAASAAGTGALTQDVLHRVIPNWGIAFASAFNSKKDSFQVMRSPLLLGIGCTIIGIIVVPLLMLLPKIIPGELSEIATGVLTPAANWLFTYIMPVLFIIAAMDSGKKTGVTAVFFGVISQFISGNALPGIVLGILVGSSWDNKGFRNSQFWILLSLTIVLFILIAYFRNVTWEQIIHFKEVKAFGSKITNDFSKINFDTNIVAYSGIVNEVK